jgi:hypothetical protein
MAAVDDLEAQSQQQHQNFYDLFGANPASGDGFVDVHNLGRQVGHQTQQARAEVVGSNFSTAVVPAAASATTSDHVPFEQHAATARTAGQVADASAQVNIRGAADVLANSRNEAAQFAAIPDRNSPEGVLQALNTISSNQAKSLETVQQSAAKEQQLGQQAANGHIQMTDYRTGPAPQAPPRPLAPPPPAPPPGPSPADAARKYAALQRAADQALVDQAAKEHRDAYLPSMEGQPGYMTKEQADAAARLRDYKTITDPGIVPQGEPGPAGQRLNDYNQSRFIGPLPLDPVLGADSRAQAQARLALQDKLENGNLSWHQQPMLPDDATRLVNQVQANDRANVLGSLQQYLQQEGMSPQAAEQISEGFTHGVIPQEYIDAASGAAKPFDAGKDALEHASDLLDHGKHWVPEVNAFTPEDIETLKKVAGRIGGFGTALEASTALYELLEGKPAGEIASKAAGGWAGAWVLGQAGAEGGAAIGGPPGAFIGALGMGTIGGLFGDKLGGDAYEWLTH